MERVFIRLLKNWGNFKKGDIITNKADWLSPLVVRRLIDKGIGEQYINKEVEE